MVRDAGPVAQVLQQLCHGPLSGDDHHLGGNLLKRDENERSLGEAGVRDVEIGLVKDEGSKEQNVEVEGAGAVLNPGGPVPAELALDVEQSVNERRGRKAGLQSNDSVEEAGLISESHGLR
jgi:hypothetical protein